MKAGLNEYEHIIVHEMESLGLLNYKATEIVHKYLPVIRELNDTHDSARIQAERYIEAYNKEIDPDIWLNKINKIRGTLPATNNKRKKSPAPLHENKKVRNVARAANYNEVLELVTNQPLHEDHRDSDDFITARVKRKSNQG